jgi:thioredoxin-related protein
MRALFSVCLFGLATAIFWGCGDKPTELSESSPESDTAADSILWTSTSVFYNTTIPKADYSLIIFGAPWCEYCQLLEEQTLIDSIVIVIMNESFNCARINVEADSLVAYYDSKVTCEEYALVHEVRGIPSTCILNRGGEMIGKIDGYHSPEHYAVYLDAIRNGSMGPPE